MVDKASSAATEAGKPKELHTSQDMLKAIKLLENLHGGGIVGLDDLDEFFESAGFDKAHEKNLRIVAELTKCSLPVREAEGRLFWAEHFDDQAVGRRIYQYRASKENLAKKVVELLIAQKPVVRAILLGAGTSVLAVTHELIRRIRDFKSLDCIYTNNFLAMSDLVRHKLSVPIRVPEGQIWMQDGDIISGEGIDGLNRKPFDAVVTSFFGLSFDQGFSSDHTYDKEEKLMNLRPARCSKIYIVLNWEKINTVDQVVATIEEGIDKNKEYFIVTDPPKNWRNSPDHADKLEEIGKWGDLVDRRVVHFVYVDRPEEGNPTSR